MPWLNLASELKRVPCDGFQTRSGLGRVHTHIECECVRLTGGKANYQNLVRVRNENLTAEAYGTNLVCRYRKCIRQVKLEQVLCDVFTSMVAREESEKDREERRRRQTNLLALMVAP